MTKHRLSQEYASWLKATPFVRGGLSGGAPGTVSHTLEAVEQAIKAGQGVVLEAQLTFDGDVVVFGEETLDALTDLTGAVNGYGSARLQAQALKGSNETIQSLSCLLPEIAGRTPVLINVCRAPRKDPLPLCFAVRRALEGYGGPIGVIAHDPRIITWFAGHARRVARGLILTDDPAWASWRQRTALWRAHALRRSHPDFCVFDVEALPSRLAARLRRRETPVLAWSVRTEEDRATATAHADNYIQEPEAAATMRPQPVLRPVVAATGS